MPDNHFGRVVKEMPNLRQPSNPKMREQTSVPQPTSSWARRVQRPFWRLVMRKKREEKLLPGTSLRRGPQSGQRLEASEASSEFPPDAVG